MKLVKTEYDKKITGVCGGIGRFFGINSTIVRVAFGISAIFAPKILLILYIVLAIALPKDY